MKCLKCGTVNKKEVNICKRCGQTLESGPWQPSWKWNIKALLIIYAVLITVYFIIKAII